MKHTSHKSLQSLVLTSALACSGLAMAQTECENSFTFTLPDASGASYAVDGPFTTSVTYIPTNLTSLSFTPDRRPGIWFSPHRGSQECDHPTYGDNPKGHDWWWLNAKWDNATPSPAPLLGMKQRLDGFVDSGFRRITLNRPGGNIFNQYVAQSHFHHLTDDQKDILEDDLADWIDDTIANIDSNFKIGAFIGSWQSGHAAAPCLGNSKGGVWWDCADDDDPSNLDFIYRSDPSDNGNTIITAENSYIDPTDQSSMQETYQNFKPWLDMNFTSLWLDNSSDSSRTNYGTTPYLGRDRTIDLIQSPDYAGTYFVGEGIPHTAINPGEDTPLTDYLDAMPWMGTHKFANDRGWLTGSSTVDPDTTEVIIVFQKQDFVTYTLADMADMRDRGFVIWVDAISTNASLAPGSVERIEWLQRLYNDLTDDFTGDIADFDGDGGVPDCDDYDLFITNWYNSYIYGSDYNGIWDGDIDGDGDVDLVDANLFGTLASWTGC